MTALILGIGGGTGSGKTTIATSLAEALGDSVVVIDHDAYYRDQSDLTPEQRARINYDHPDSLDNDLLLNHLITLKSGRGIEKPVYDFKTHTRSAETVQLSPAPIIVVEGILTLSLPELREVMDIRIFVDTAADIRLIRRIRRDLEHRGRSFDSIRRQYYETVRPMHLAFVEPSKAFADIIIPEGGQTSQTGQREIDIEAESPTKKLGNRIAIDLLVGRLLHFLRESQGTTGA